jgi:predicted permease
MSHEPESPRPDPRSPRQIRDDVDEEIRFHLEMRAAALEAEGMDPAAAREEALRRFGDREATRREAIGSDLRLERSAQRREYLGEVAQDLAHGIRQLRTRPGFAIAAVLTLAVGIGASTAIFGAADHVLLRALPYRDVGRVMTVWESDRASNETRRQASPGNLLAWKERCTSFESMGLVEPTGFEFTGQGPPEPVAAWYASDGYFGALGVTPRIGRLFQPEEYREGGAQVVLISYGLWQRRFASDPSVVGRTVELDHQAATIVGVLPPDLEYPKSKDLWAPKRFRADEPMDHRSSYMDAVARLRPGVSVAAARADLARVAKQLAAELPQTNANLGAELVPIEDQVLGRVRPALLALLGAVGLMLLIACANIAGLLLARGAEREREFAVRAALGASSARLTRQLLTESLILAVLGGTLGWGIAWFGTKALVALAPWLPRVSSVALDGRVLMFSLGLTLASAILFGLAPALRFARPELARSMTSGARAAGGRSQTGLRGGLVMAEISLALVLLAGAGLLIRSFTALLANDVGFVTEHRLSLQMFLWDRNPTEEQRHQRADQIIERFRAVQGVEDVGVVTALPFHPSQIDAQGSLSIEGRAVPGQSEEQVYTTIASPAYFRVMGIPLLAGRPFGDHDRKDAPRVALISRALARRCFPDTDPIGKRVTIGVMGAPVAREIVGVVGDVRPTSLDSEPRAELFIPFDQSPNGSLTFVVRASREPRVLIPLLRRMVWEIDPQQSVYYAAATDDLVAGTLAERRFILLLFGVFAAFAIGLAGIGVYGLISVTTGQRTQEFGVRVALGARPRDIVRLILGEGMRLIVPGLVFGLLGAFFLTRFLSGMLYGVRPADPATLAQVTVVMLAIAILGAFVPALRAAGTEPNRALRSE